MDEDDEVQAVKAQLTAKIDELESEVVRLRRQVSAYAQHETSRVADLKAITARLQGVLNGDTVPAVASS